MPQGQASSSFTLKDLFRVKSSLSGLMALALVRNPLSRQSGGLTLGVWREERTSHTAATPPFPGPRTPLVGLKPGVASQLLLV